MKRHPLYSKSKIGLRLEDLAPSEPTLRERAGRKLRAFHARFEKPLLALGSAALALGLFFGIQALQPKTKVLTQADIDKAVAYTLEKHPAPSVASVAAELVRPSVVRVTGYDPSRTETDEDNGVGVASGPDGKVDHEAISVGSGVIMSENGDILTNLHVVSGAPVLRVTFSNGLVSEADIVGIQSKDDLAVIRAREQPDDMKPAVLTSTRNLRPGDEVVAVGFPFAIGPSVSAGVVSGLKREWVFDESRRTGNLIQFDAAANPGNSGGPLVNRRGEVLGIVTGILNPTKQSVFIGIGFAVPIENAATAVGRNPF
jgi:serine protease DegQ